MIIECINCNKQFQVNSELIPKEGRTIQCGSCNHIWFYKNIEIPKKKVINKKTKINEKFEKTLKKNDKNLVNQIDTIINKKDKALIKYEKSSKFTLDLLLRLLIVFIISFVALILVLETFKIPLSVFFPNLELLLFNFYETLIDINLFFKNLIKKT